VAFLKGMVHSEGFEPPTYWFVANCSIQLSYECTRAEALIQDSKTAPFVQLCPVEELRLNHGRIIDLQGLFCRRWIDDHNASATDELTHGGFRKTGCIVLKTNCLCAFIERDAANAIDLANAGDGQHGVLRGRRGEVVQHVNSSHQGEGYQARSAEREQRMYKVYTAVSNS
jgi:hypothetical protein